MTAICGTSLAELSHRLIAVYEKDVTVPLLDALVENDIRFNIVASKHLADYRFSEVD